MARNFTDHEAIEGEVRAGKFTIHFAYEGKLLNAASPDVEWLGSEVTALTAKQYVRDLRRRAKESGLRKAQEGWYPGKPPLGYLKQKAVNPDGQPKDRGGIIILTDWGCSLLRRMRDLRVQGLSLGSLAEKVIQEGLVPDRYLRGFRGQRGVSNTERLLKHPFYIGRFEWNGEMYQGKHEPVFTHSEWDELQATFGIKTAYRPTKHEGLFAGAGLRLHCAECGSLVTYAPKTKASGKVYRYYRCADGHGIQPREINITEESIMTQLGSVVDLIQITNQRAMEITDALNATHRRAQTAKEREEEECDLALRDVRSKEDRLYDRLDVGNIDSDEYKRQRERLRSQADSLQDRRRQAQRQIDGAYLITAQKLLEFAKLAKELWKSRSTIERRDFIAKLVWNPVLDGATVRYELKKPFQLLAEMGKTEAWRAWQDSNLLPSA